ncbi:MAG: cytochrome C oxidase subunit IV family protein [Deltaproteobacteria bacterium]|jgi:cytochrome c oxidase subunit 4|nr:cytochrome C oxidase subunit IV family protein [Deltaproteobacteria bacterium]MCW8892713.1 cytochrome C oxidase subunit IV family protein [Deltaproteobacteria bacterium]MCW9049775.1 cytochrome C oxidase subunit IV family protein [Deltaproteobacteria bacterium]
MEDKHAPVPYRTYFQIWAVLFVLTLVNVAISQIAQYSLKVWAILAIASIQASLILTILMHLKQESKLFRIGILTLIVIVAIFIGLTFSDVHYR